MRVRGSKFPKVGGRKKFTPERMTIEIYKPDYEMLSKLAQSLDIPRIRILSQLIESAFNNYQAYVQSNNAIPVPKKR